MLAALELGGIQEPMEATYCSVVVWSWSGLIETNTTGPLNSIMECTSMIPSLDDQIAP